jgi:hypothetical protein
VSRGLWGELHWKRFCVPNLAALINDAGFLDIVDRVAEAFHADPAIRAEFESLLAALSRQ